MQLLKGIKNNSQASFNLHVHTKISGRQKLYVGDEQGWEPILSGPNLITDTGLNKHGSTRGLWTSLARKVLNVGTDSTPPAFTDTALGNEVLSGQDNGGFGDVTTYTIQGNEMVGSFKRTRVLTFTSAVNLAEWGFQDDEGQQVIRALFLDETLTPTSISIVAGKKLRLEHELEGRLPFVATAQQLKMQDVDIANQNAPTVSDATNASPIVITTLQDHPLVTGDKAEITGVAGNTAANGIHTVTVVDSKNFSLDGTTGNGVYTSGGLVTRIFDGQKTFYTGGGFENILFVVAEPVVGGYMGTITAAGQPTSPTQGLTATSAVHLENAFEPYIANSFERTKIYTLSESKGNGAAHGFWLGGPTTFNTSFGFKFVFDAGNSFIKDGTHIIKALLTLTWSRA